MKAGYSCKLFGAHQALMGVKDAVVLLHSVVGCNFSTMGLHFTACDMTDVRQTCTVISDSEVVFGGEASLKKALDNIAELYSPKYIFVITGCVSDIIQDDAKTVCKSFEESSGIRTLCIEAAGYRGSIDDGYEDALLALGKELMGDALINDRSSIDHGSEREKNDVNRPNEDTTGPNKIPVINILGLGADDHRLRSDIKAIRDMLEPKVNVGCIFGSCIAEDIKRASDADLNLVIGRGIKLADYMKEEFNIPYECIDYPYGLTGAKELWSVMDKYFEMDHSEEVLSFKKYTAEECKRSYSYIQSLYGMPAAVIGSRARAKGMARFLSSELGMEIEVLAIREDHRDMDEVYDLIRSSEAAMVFGSSFERDICLELGIPLFKYDFPVFDRVILSDRPLAGKKGTLCLIEDILNAITDSRSTERPLYR